VQANFEDFLIRPAFKQFDFVELLQFHQQLDARSLVRTNVIAHAQMASIFEPIEHNWAPPKLNRTPFKPPTRTGSISSATVSFEQFVRQLLVFLMAPNWTLVLLIPGFNGCSSMTQAANVPKVSAIRWGP
jgi:hypothetical protein